MGARASVSSLWGQNETPDITKEKESQPSKSTRIKTNNKKTPKTTLFTWWPLCVIRMEGEQRGWGAGARKLSLGSLSSVGFSCSSFQIYPGLGWHCGLRNNIELYFFFFTFIYFILYYFISHMCFLKNNKVSLVIFI